MKGLCWKMDRCSHAAVAKVEKTTLNDVARALWLGIIFERKGRGGRERKKKPSRWAQVLRPSKEVGVQ